MNNLKQSREKIGLSQKALADLVGVSAPMITQLETGKRSPSLRTAQKIVSALSLNGGKCSINDLFPPEDFKQAS